MSAITNVFKLLVPSHITSVDLMGSWDNYSTRNAMVNLGEGNWGMTLTFTGDSSSRFWYYYILDGYFESHDPNEPTTIEPTRNITLNILDPSAVYAYDSDTSGSISPVDSFGGRSSSSNTSVDSLSDKEFRSASPDSVYDGPKIYQPVPKNPMGNHKLTLDTNFDRYSMITTAATISPSSPLSGYRSGRSSGGVSPAQSICSSCSGTTFEEDSLPGTPICNCSLSAHEGTCNPRDFFRKQFDVDSVDDESASDSDGSMPHTKLRLSKGYSKDYRLSRTEQWALEEATRKLALH